MEKRYTISNSLSEDFQFVAFWSLSWFAGMLLPSCSAGRQRGDGTQLSSRSLSNKDWTLLALIKGKLNDNSCEIGWIEVAPRMRWMYVSFPNHSFKLSIYPEKYVIINKQFSAWNGHAFPAVKNFPHMLQFFLHFN